MASDATIVTGRRVADRYRLAQPRRDGAWDAIDETLKRHVVVHLLAADADDAAKTHFTAQARTLARLNHRNIVSTYDTGVDGDGVSYRVDELAAGHPLELNDVDDAHRLSYARQITQALAEAHDVGLVHGSLQSGSVLVDDDGRVQVGGFQLPANDAALDAAQRRDLDSLVGLVIALAPPGNAPLRDVAVTWRNAPPASAAAMTDALAAIDNRTVQVPAPPPTPATGVPPVKGRGPRPVTVVIVAMVAAGAIAAAVVLPGRMKGETFAGPAVALTVTAKSFDPEGSDKTENEADARLAVDGQATTAWATDRYHRANFGNLKKGLGLVLQTQQGTAEFTEVVITSPTRGWHADIYVAEQPAATLAAWGEPVAGATIAGGRTTLTLDSLPKGAALLVWITKPGSNLQVRISEVTVEGRV